ncbi:MAG: Dabb family protein, partial [Candidatus Eremiobacteraeota bacterium]|nr:Dabb family protein [Candidatus Eremiobacteraeota bacterium]
MTERANFFHNVFFWLRDAGAAERVAEGCKRHLSAIPDIVRLTVGFPSGPSQLPVDSSYGVALLIEFTGSAAHDAYEVHPDHLRFVDEFGPLFSRVVVYDVESSIGG